MASETKSQWWSCIFSTCPQIFSLLLFTASLNGLCHPILHLASRWECCQELRHMRLFISQLLSVGSPQADCVSVEDSSPCQGTPAIQLSVFRFQWSLLLCPFVPRDGDDVSLLLALVLQDPLPSFFKKPSRWSHLFPARTRTDKNDLISILDPDMPKHSDTHDSSEFWARYLDSFWLQKLIAFLPWGIYLNWYFYSFANTREASYV